MFRQAWVAAQDADLVFLVVDVALRQQTLAHEILATLEKNHISTILILNKIDLIPKARLLPLVASFQESYTLRKVFMISAQNHDGVGDLLKCLQNSLPLVPWLFPADQVSTIPARVLAAEVTR